MFANAPLSAAPFSTEVGLSLQFSVTGLSATSSLSGDFSFSLGSTVPVTGLSLAANVSSARIWGLILPGQSPSYIEVSPTQDSVYESITPTQASSYDIITPDLSSGWVEIVPDQDAIYSEV